MNQIIHDRALFIFRRDLRLDDNTALIRAVAESRMVSTAFIFDPRQCEPHDYFSPNACQFLKASLDELSRAVAEAGGCLQLFYGPAEKVVEELTGPGGFQAVYVNRDYTPFSRRRDAAMKKAVLRRGGVFEECDDALLCPPGSVLKDGGLPYTVFTPFYRKAMIRGVDQPRRHAGNNLCPDLVLSAYAARPEQLPAYQNSRLGVRPGRAAGLSILESAGRFREYQTQRDQPFREATTQLSAHHKFGTVSIRESHRALIRSLGGDHPLIRQLYWRDFLTLIAYYFPHVFGQPFCEEYKGIPWENRAELFDSWCGGRTGVPIVDAGMRELTATGWMHNRVRMIAASYLVKDLRCDWRLGERFFARHLTDYDPSVNNGNWQWVASTGCDHQPYFRVFNPWLQQKKFDPQAEYLLRWVPELSGLPLAQVHNPARDGRAGMNYPSPVVDHADAVAWSKTVFGEAVRRYKKG